MKSNIKPINNTEATKGGKSIKKESKFINDVETVNNSESIIGSKPNYAMRKLTRVVIFLIIITSATSYYFYTQVRTLQEDPNKINEEKVIALVQKVEILIALPEGELPTVVTVSDTAPLEGNPFFKNAEVGDQVLLYTAAQKAFLYNPKSNIIIEVASLNIGQ